MRYVRIFGGLPCRRRGIVVSVRVFISYRRADTLGIAGRISDRLKKRLGTKNVFFDVDDIRAATRWRETLAERVGACNALVALIGKNWNPISGIESRRLDDPDDTLRIEIETAIERSITVVPVLVGGATLPGAENLPDSLKQLPEWQSLDVTESRFEYDIERLIRALPTSRRWGGVRLWVATVFVAGTLLLGVTSIFVFPHLHVTDSVKWILGNEIATKTGADVLGGKQDPKQAISAVVMGNNEEIPLRILALKLAIRYNLAGYLKNVDGVSQKVIFQGAIERVNHAVDELREMSNATDPFGEPIHVYTESISVNPSLNTFTIPSWTSVDMNITHPYTLVYNLRAPDETVSMSEAKELWYNILKSTLSNDDIKKLDKSYRPDQ